MPKFSKDDLIKLKIIQLEERVEDICIKLEKYIKLIKQPTSDSVKAKGDTEKGEKIFKTKCQQCHSIENVNKTGPSLNGLFNRTAGKYEKFKNYSDGMKNSSIVWTDSTLSDFLQNPKKKIPTTRMVFAGLKNEFDRDDVIAYLKTATRS